MSFPVASVSNIAQHNTITDCESRIPASFCVLILYCILDIVRDALKRL